MVPVLMPPNEVVEAMGRGTIDAVTTSPSAFVDFGMERVANSAYFLQLGTNSFAVLMNRAKFESLPKAAQDVLLKHGGKALGERYIKEINANWVELMDRFKADPKRTVVFPTEADQKAADVVFASVAKEWGARDPRNEALLAKARSMLNDIRAKYPSQ
jgi:TRAP-type C4-dicarboxylate transport system substrate-binding protein